MYDSELAYTILLQIDRALETIQRRFAPVASLDDFTATDAGMEKLDAICMQLIAVGESVKNLDKVTNGALLVHYPTVEWKRVMGMRDVISHHYFDVDAEVVFAVCAEHIPNMEVVVKRMLADLSQNALSFDDEDK
jgi:uncharacterized protein with HEPN domain